MAYEVQPPGGFTYRVYDNDLIEIIAGPEYVGKSFSKGSATGQSVLRVIESSGAPKYPVGHFSTGKKEAPAWLDDVIGLGIDLTSFIVDEAKKGGKNTLAKLQKQLEQKRGQLASTTNPARKVQLQAEIAAIESQIAFYEGAIMQAGVNPSTLPEPKTGLNLLPIGVGLAVVAGVAFLASRR